MPKYGDALITLSTCEHSQENGRIVVIARKTGVVDKGDIQAGTIY